MTCVRAALLAAFVSVLTSGLVPALAAAGAGQDTLVLARVDDRVIRAADFRSAYLNADASTRPAADSAGRVAFLKTLIDKEVLGITVTRREPALRVEDRVALREYTDDQLARALYRRRVTDHSKVTEDDLKHSYDQFKVQLRLRTLLFQERDQAERVRALLAQHRLSWHEAARQSIPVDTLPDGELGWVRREMLSGPSAPRVFSLVPGDLSPVFRDDDGFRLWQCLGRGSVGDPLPYQGVRLKLIQDLRAMRGQPFHDRLFEELRAQTALRYDSTNVRWLAERFAAANPRPKSASTIDLTRRAPHIEPADTSRVLATTRSRRFSVGDFLSLYAGTPPILRAKITGRASLQEVLDRMILRPVMADVARHEHLDQQPDVAALLKRRREGLLVERVYQDSVMSRVRVTPAARRKFYEDHRKEYIMREHVRYAGFPRWSSAGADSLMAQLRAGASPDSLEARDRSAGITQGGIFELYDNQPNNYHSVLFEELKPGQSTKIGPSDDGAFVILHLISRDPSRPLKYEEAENMADQAVEEIEAERILQGWLVRLRRQHRIVSHPERLMQVSLRDTGYEDFMTQ